MPIGVPRILYCWAEEVPPQWTDIYNFIFRRRMVFLMQYLDDELCNQICGLLINIHMEDRSKEMEKKDVEKSGIFKTKGTNLPSSPKEGPGSSFSGGNGEGDKSQPTKALNLAKDLKKEKSIETLLSSYNNSNYEEDLTIDENVTLGQYALQEITLEWLNWNAQFFDFSDEPYFFQLAEILSKDFSKDDTQLGFSDKTSLFSPSFPEGTGTEKGQIGGRDSAFSLLSQASISEPKDFKRGQDVYSPFRSIVNLANLISQDKNFSIKNLSPNSLSAMGNQEKNTKALLYNSSQKPGLSKLIEALASKDFINKSASPLQTQGSNKALGQRNLRSEYNIDNLTKTSLNHTKTKTRSFSPLKKQKKGISALNYLDFDSNPVSNLFAEPKNKNDYSRQQAKKAFQEEESKKVFVVINSFGGSVGNGITVHDALQFIKAGSLTLGLGVAASAASLVLAGGTISERFVTEGCHIMLHQPEGSINGQASDIWVDSQEILKIRLDVAEIYSLSAHRPRHKILRDLDRDFYLTAQETIQYGLADEIATNEVMHEIIEMTSKVWDYHDGKQQRLLEAHDQKNSSFESETKN